jgi:choline-sulfatase
MSKPNVVFIISDQHRGDWMGCAGSRIVDTPNLDRMAHEGVQFTRAYCNSPLCVPSRMSMMTGRYPHNTQVFSNNDHLSSDTPTIAHAMGLAGYETVLCGRMHFVGPDQRHGFQKRLVGDITASYLGGPATPYGDLSGTSGQGLRSIHKAGPGTSPVIQFDEKVVAGCEQILADRSAANDGRPLFLTVGFYGPHHPYVCPQEYYERALAAMEREGDVPLAGGEQPRHPWLADWFERLEADAITPGQLRTARACYAGLISLTDTYVGRILKAAEALPGETIVVYASDHGDMAGDRGMFWKRSFFEGAVRIPMIWHQLGGKGNAVARRLTIGSPVSLVDLAPTFAGLADAPELPALDGCDLRDLLSGAVRADEQSWNQRAVFSELANPQDSAIRAVICGSMKLISYYGHEDVMLFDLAKDPGEQRDLSMDPAYAAVKKELLSRVSEGWNPETILQQVRTKGKDQKYLSEWGKRVGMGPLDLWCEG